MHGKRGCWHLIASSVKFKHSYHIVSSKHDSLKMTVDFRCVSFTRVVIQYSYQPSFFYYSSYNNTHVHFTQEEFKETLGRFEFKQTTIRISLPTKSISYMCNYYTFVFDYCYNLTLWTTDWVWVIWGERERDEVVLFCITLSHIRDSKNISHFGFTLTHTQGNHPCSSNA